MPWQAPRAGRTLPFRAEFKSISELYEMPRRASAGVAGFAARLSLSAWIEQSRIPFNDLHSLCIFAGAEIIQ